MYYLFFRKQKDLDKYKKEFDRVSNSIKNGTTPVFNEMRSAKTQLFESIPYHLINGLLLVGGTYLLNLLNINALLSVAIVLVVNSLCGEIANFIFTMIKHALRIRLCKKLNIEPNEHNIAVMESMEYQSV